MAPLPVLAKPWLVVPRRRVAHLRCASRVNSQIERYKSALTWITCCSPRFPLCVVTSPGPSFQPAGRGALASQHGGVDQRSVKPLSIHRLAQKLELGPTSHRGELASALMRSAGIFPNALRSLSMASTPVTPRDN
jgi:hypothetical protein